MGRPKLKQICVITVSAIALTWSGAAAAQTAADDASQPAQEETAGVAEILVTAQRKSESAQNVPISIAAFSGSDLQELGVSQPIDIAAQTPGLYIKNGIGSANPYISVRNVGQSLFVGNASQPVGMYVNDVNLSYTSVMSQPLFDIERVEVLKGPQGTLFGRNSTGGALSYFTAQPTSNTEGSIIAQFGNKAMVDVEGYINLPLSPTLSTRAAVKVRRQDGFHHNTLTGNDLGATDYWAGRLTTKWESGDSFTALLALDASFDRSGNVPWVSFGFADPSVPVTNADLIAAGRAQGDGVNFAAGNAFGRNEVYGSTPFVTAGLGQNNCSEQNTRAELIARNEAGLCATHLGQSGDRDLYSGAYSLEPKIRHDLYSAVLNLQYDFDWATATSITGYVNSDRILEEEFDGTAAISADNTYRGKTELFSQELRFAGDSSLLDWVGGVYYSHDRIDESDTYKYDNIWFFTHLVDFRQKTENFGVFGHTKWNLSDTIGLILAGRYTRERISFDGGTDVINVIDPDLDVFGYGLPLTAQQRTRPPAGFESTLAKSFTWKVGLEYNPDNNILLYGFATKGVKSGGYNGTWTVTDAELRPYRPESLIDYEVGFKTNLMDRALQLNGSLFYYDYRNLQAFVLNSSALFVVDNIPKTSVRGGELDLQFVPTQSLNLRLGISYTDAQIEQVTADQISNGIFAGNTTANSAKLTFNGLAKYDIPLSDTIDLSVQGDFNYQGKTYFTVQNTPASSQDAYWLFNARITIAPSDGPWSFAIWGKNLANKVYVTEAFPDPGEGLISYNLGTPRTFGGTISYKF